VRLVHDDQVEVANAKALLRTGAVVDPMASGLPSSPQST
jgi:hypothetical protein